MLGEIRGATVVVAVLLGVLAVPACTQPGNTSKEATGQALGARACRSGMKWIPREIRSISREIGITPLSGSVFGCGYLGGQIGLALDEMDREKMNEAAQAALDTGKVQTWDNDETANSGTAKIVKTASAAKGRGDCKTVRNTIVLADGSRKQEDVTACRNADGGWEAVEG